MTLNDGGKVFPASFKPKGYYYTKVSKQYDSITEEELNVRFDLAKEFISELERVNYDYIYFEEKSINYSDYTRYEVYYAKIGGVILGKVSYTITQVIDGKYNLMLVFAEHLVLPLSHSRGKKIKLKYKPYTYSKEDMITTKRRNGRKWRHNKRHKTRDTQSED